MPHSNPASAGARPLTADDPALTVGETLIDGVAQKGRFGGEEVWTLNYAYSAFGLWYSEELLERHGWSPPVTFFVAPQRGYRPSGPA